MTEITVGQHVKIGVIVLKGTGALVRNLSILKCLRNDARRCTAFPGDD